MAAEQSASNGGLAGGDLSFWRGSYKGHASWAQFSVGLGQLPRGVASYTCIIHFVKFVRRRGGVLAKRGRVRQLIECSLVSPF